MISLLFVCIGHFAYGITNTLWYNPRNTIGTLPLIILRSFSCFIIFFSAFLIFNYYNISPQKSYSLNSIFSAIGICFINYFGLFFFLKSLKHTQISNTIGFGKIGLIIGILIGYFYYNETISSSKLICGIFILIGISFIEKSAGTKQKLSKGLIYSVLSRVFWASGFLFIPYIKELGVLLFCSILEAVVFLMSILLFTLSKKKSFNKVNNRVIKEIVLLIILGTIGTFCLNFAIISIKSIIVFAFIGLIEPVIGLITSITYHKEELNKIQTLGIIVTIFSSIIISLL